MQLIFEIKCCDPLVRRWIWRTFIDVYDNWTRGESGGQTVGKFETHQPYAIIKFLEMMIFHLFNFRIIDLECFKFTFII